MYKIVVLQKMWLKRLDAQYLSAIMANIFLIQSK